jgi:hypothetical protein
MRITEDVTKFAARKGISEEATFDVGRKKKQESSKKRAW